MPARKSISFDVLGTCFSLTAAIAAISTRLGPTLAAHGRDATTLCHQWFYAAQRDFTYAALCGSYVPIATVLRATFPRACYVVDVPVGAVSEADVDAVMAAFRRLGPRPGLQAAWAALRAAGWEVGAVTNGGVAASVAYFRAAGVAIDEGQVFSCDAVRAAKPEARVYAAVNAHLTARGVAAGGEGGGERWFVAAHAWDLLAARQAGFRTAYLTFEEHDPVTEVFGEFNVYADSMEELVVKLGEV